METRGPTRVRLDRLAHIDVTKTTFDGTYMALAQGSDGCFVTINDVSRCERPVTIGCRAVRVRGACTGMGTTNKWPAAGSDPEVEAAFARGDRRRVLALLMASHGDGVFRYAMAMTRDRHLADEIRQQVFVEVYRDLGSVSDAQTLPVWMFGIARHRCLDAIHARVRWTERYKNDPPEHAEQADCDLERDLDRERLARILAACLAKLSPAARDAVVLRYQQELSYDEAAAVAGEMPGTLQRRVARALPVLRKCVRATLQLRPPPTTETVDHESLGS